MTSSRLLGFAAAALCASACPLLAALAAEDLPVIVAAAKADQRDAVARLLERGENVNAAEADGTTALHWAARATDTQLVKRLLAAGAAANGANRYGVTALQLAAENGDASTVRALLTAGADPNAVLPEGETVLMTAARTGSPEALRLLLDAGADVHAREHWYGETALIWATAQDHAAAVKLLLAHAADVNERSAPQHFDKRRAGQSILSLGEWTPLMYAAREDARSAAAALIAAHAGLDLVDPDGATALVIAILNANYDLAKQLLDAGADPNVVDNDAGMGALYAAVDMHRLAVGHGRPNPRPSGTFGAEDVVRALLAHGANPNARLKKPIMQRQHTFGDGSLGEGATPLMRAAKSGDVALMKQLLDAGADPKVEMPNGSNALMYAVGLGWRNGSALAPSYDQGSDEDAIEAIRLLRRLGLELDAANHDGDTPLHAAVAGRHSDKIVRYLLDEGANPTAANAKGQTPLAVAEARGPPEVFAMLREAAGR
ncbi:MAG TPA: ankyrin repeat domain-containing protein [Gammaproteobacteria bacterium]|nr:ankyrin repeat domain-containing protein [Gammaproteobacteria bacterium]